MIFFDLFISDKPELLEKYPYLKYQYVSENGIEVKKRKVQEVVQDLLNFEYSGMNESEMLETKVFFAKILSSMQVEKEEQLTSSAKK